MVSKRAASELEWESTQVHFSMFETKLKLGKNPKEKAGIFSRLTFFYLDELFATGFASERERAIVTQ